MSNLINLIQKNDNYYFKSDKISVYPCAYRGGIPNADNTYTYFDPASRYTSEKNIISAVVGLVPNGTYISDISTHPVELAGSEIVHEVVAGTWKFTIGGYNFEAQLDTEDLSTLTAGGKKFKFEIDPQELSDGAGLGKVLTSYEATNGDLTNLDQQFGLDYCFTGLKVVIVPDTEEPPHRPTATQLIPILHTTINNAVDSTNNGPALVRNQYARLPEITHGQLEGEAEVTKLNVLQNITLDTADAKDLLVEEQLIVGTGRNTNANILKVTLDCDDSGNPQNPCIEVNNAPVTIDNVPEGKAPVTVNVNSSPALIKASSSDSEAIVLSVEGSAGVSKNLTVINRATAGALGVGNDAFVVDTSGTTIKNNLAVKDGTADKFTVAATSGDTVIAGTLDVTAGATLKSTLDIADSLSINSNKFTVNADGNTTVAGTLDVTGSTTVKNNLTVKDTTGARERFKVDSATGNTIITGTLSVGPNGEGENPYLNITVTEGTGTLTEVSTDSFKARGITGESLAVNGDLSTGNISSTSEGTSIIGNLIVKDSSALNNDKFKVESTKTTIATDTTEITGNNTIKGDLTVSSGTESTDSTTGALKVTGGAGVGGALNVRGGLSASSLVINSDDFKVADDHTNITTSTTTITGATTINNTLEVTGDTTVSGTLTATNGLQINETNKFSKNSEGIWELTAESVKASTLYVPDDTTAGCTPFSIKAGKNVTINKVSVPTKIFQFGGDDYTLTPTIAKAQLLKMIYPVGSIYMTMTTDSPVDLFGGEWQRISQGRVLLGAGDATNDKGEVLKNDKGEVLKTFNKGALGGYYDPQPWSHSHKYNKVKTSTENCYLIGNQLPRQDFILQFFVAEGADKDNILRWCGGSNLDGCGTTNAGDGSHARVVGAQIENDLKKFHETEGFWKFHYGESYATNSNGVRCGYGHNHGIGSGAAYTTDNPTTTQQGNLPPYLVCYIWQRTK